MNRSKIRKIRLNSILIPFVGVALYVLIILASPVWLALEVLLFIPLVLVKWTIWVLYGKQLDLRKLTIRGALDCIKGRFDMMGADNLNGIPSCDYCRWCAWDEETNRWYCDHPTTPHRAHYTSAKMRLYCFTEKEENE